jgi:hypothetical protein
VYFDISAIYQPTATPLSFWMETLSIFVGDVLASVFVAGGAYFAWYLLKYPGFRVGANWSFSGWDVAKMGRLPGGSDDVSMSLMPNISIVSRDATVRKIITSVWVRERADVHNPGVIHGVRHLQRDGVPPELRTTGGDLLAFYGPTIQCNANKFGQISNCPIFIETSEGEYFQAQSPGNSPIRLARLRYRIQDFVYIAKQRILTKLG